MPRAFPHPRPGIGPDRRWSTESGTAHGRIDVLDYESGFTLLEIMLVVLVIAIAATFVNLSIAPDPGRIALRESDRVAALIRQLMDESVLRGRAMSLIMDAEQRRYSFQISRSGNWEPVTDTDIFRSRVIPRPLSVSLEIHGESPRPVRADQGIGDALADARIIVDPVGEITPFRITLTAPDQAVFVTLDEFQDVVVMPATP